MMYDFNQFCEMVAGGSATNECYFAVVESDANQTDIRFYDTAAEATKDADGVYDSLSQRERYNKSRVLDVIKFNEPVCVEASEIIKSLYDATNGVDNIEVFYSPFDLHIVNVDDFFDEVIIPPNVGVWRINCKTQDMIITDNAGRVWSAKTPHTTPRAKLWGALRFIGHNLPFGIYMLLRRIRIFSETDSEYFILWSD